MSAPKFTPGPWRLVDGSMVFAGDYLVTDTEPIGDFITSQQSADARLIAAAPDLYTALRDLIGCLGADGYFPSAGKPKTDAARAALKKAVP